MANDTKSCLDILSDENATYQDKVVAIFTCGIEDLKKQQDVSQDQIGELRTLLNG